MAYENFQQWMGDFLGVRYELEPSSARTKKVRDTGRMDPTKGEIRVEALAKLRPDVDRREYFQAMDRYIHGRDEEGMRNAMEFNLAGFRAALKAQLEAPDNVKLSFNVELAGVVLPGFADAVEEELNRLSPADRRKVRGMGVEYTERDLDLLREDENVDPAKVHANTGKHLGGYLRNAQRLNALGFQNIVDDLVIDRAHPDRPDPRLLSPNIDAVKIDTLGLKPKKDAGGAFIDAKVRDTLRLDGNALATIALGLRQLRQRGGGKVAKDGDPKGGPLHVTFEGIGGYDNIDQIHAIGAENPDLDYAMQGFAFAQPNDSLLALVGAPLDRPHLKRGYVEPKEKPRRSTRPGSAWRQVQVLGAGIVLSAVGMAAALVGSMRSSGPELHPNEVPVDGKDTVQVLPAGDALLERAAPTSNRVSIQHFDNTDLQDGKVRYQGEVFDLTPLQDDGRQHVQLRPGQTIQPGVQAFFDDYLRSISPVARAESGLSVAEADAQWRSNRLAFEARLRVPVPAASLTRGSATGGPG